jgi:histidinol dehydrogenase
MISLRRYNVGTPEATALTVRSAVPDQSVRESAAEICADVRRRGDVAVRENSEEFGGGRKEVRVSRAEMQAALNVADPQLVSAIEAAIANVRTVHRAQLPVGHTSHPVAGVSVERAWSPINRVGAYVPGGSAAYPSTLIMTVVPAQVAGVKQIVVTSPAAEGVIHPAMLTAAAILDIDEFYAIGGAQAVAALAYGTESIPRVQKIVGPGNAYVTAAKLEVFGTCSIDLPAGPSEVLVICDGSENPTHVATDLLCQAEHGPDSPAVLVSTNQEFLGRVEDALSRILATLDRSTILSAALANHGALVFASTLTEAVAFANAYAPEHITVLTADPEALVPQLTGAGSVYVGPWAPESAGDYATGANHVLPTGGLAHAEGPLSTQDFGSWRQIQRITQDGLKTLAPTITTLARAEGLTAHAFSAEIRLTNQHVKESTS